MFYFGSFHLLTWDKVFKNGPSKICERQPLKSFTWSSREYFVPNDSSGSKIVP